MFGTGRRNRSDVQGHYRSITRLSSLWVDNCPSFPSHGMNRSMDHTVRRHCGPWCQWRLDARLTGKSCLPGRSVQGRWSWFQLICTLPYHHRIHSHFTPVSSRIPRLSRFLESAGSVLKYFEPFLGRIEILGEPFMHFCKCRYSVTQFHCISRSRLAGSGNRIERVYFEIKEANLAQWEKPQIKVRFLRASFPRSRVFE